MGRFRGKSSAAAKAKRDFIRINPYEIPEIALSVIANICQKNNTDDASFVIGKLREELGKLDNNGRSFYDFIDNYRKDIFELDFRHKLSELLNDIVVELLAHENTNDTQVVVAGGFSAGKSSFLNNLIGADELLPTGIDPVSMVATYLYCDANTKEITVKGINHKNAVVLLDKDVLQSIQHESKSKVYLASVLDKLFVEVPSKLCDGFVFIDTPGYNNSDKKNDTNNRSDGETALEAIGNGNVLLWIVDTGAGTIPKKDMEVIQMFLEKDENRRVAVIFNKADKKGDAASNEIKSIVDQAYQALRKYGHAIIDVMAYSSHEGRVYYSVKSFSMKDLLDELRRSGNGNSGIERLRQDLLELFEDEIYFAENMVIPCYEKQRKELLSAKNECYQNLRNEKEGTKSYKEKIDSIMVESYGDIMCKLDIFIDLSTDAVNEWLDSLEEIESTNQNNWSTKDNISSLVRRFISKRNSLTSKMKKSCQYEYWSDDARMDFAEDIGGQLDRVDSFLAERYEDIENKLSDVSTNINKYKEIAHGMRYYMNIVKSTLDSSIKQFRMSAHKVQDARVDFSQSTDVFAAIRSRDYSKFITCFANGVKLSDSNPEGYTPLTYAVKYGAYDMVKFFIEKNTDLSDNDANGYNALHTAIKETHIPIIELLLGADPRLAYAQTASGKTVKEIAKDTCVQHSVLNKLI